MTTAVFGKWVIASKELKTTDLCSAAAATVTLVLAPRRSIGQVWELLACLHGALPCCAEHSSIVCWPAGTFPPDVLCSLPILYVPSLCSMFLPMLYVPSRCSAMFTVDAPLWSLLILRAVLTASADRPQYSLLVLLSIHC